MASRANRSRADVRLLIVLTSVTYTWRCETHMTALLWMLFASHVSVKVRKNPKINSGSFVTSKWAFIFDLIVSTILATDLEKMSSYCGESFARLYVR